MIRVLAKSINNVVIMLYSLSLLPLEVSCNEGSAGLILWIIKTLSNYKNYTTCIEWLLS